MWGVAWDWGTTPTFLVTLKFNCRSSILSLAVTVLYCPHFPLSYTLWILPFIPRLKSNSVPPDFYATTGSTLGKNCSQSCRWFTSLLFDKILDVEGYYGNNPTYNTLVIIKQLFLTLREINCHIFQPPHKV